MMEINKRGGAYEKDRLEVVDYDMELIDAASSGGRLGGEHVYAGRSKPEKKPNPKPGFLRTCDSSVCLSSNDVSSMLAMKTVYPPRISFCLSA